LPIRHILLGSLRVARFAGTTILPRFHVALRELESDHAGPLLPAAFSGGRRSLTVAALLRSFCSLPLVASRSSPIRWEALRLWL
jgi:DUF1365 family protein